MKPGLQSGFLPAWFSVWSSAVDLFLSNLRSNPTLAMWNVLFWCPASWRHDIAVIRLDGQKTWCRFPRGLLNTDSASVSERTCLSRVILPKPVVESEESRIWTTQNKLRLGVETGTSGDWDDLSDDKPNVTSVRVKRWDESLFANCPVIIY